MIRPKLPWAPEQEQVLRAHPMLSAAELLPLVNAAGPPRSLCAIDSRRSLLDLTRPRPKGSINKIAAITTNVAAAHGLTLDDLVGPSRLKHVFRARRQAMAEVYATGSYSYITIGRYFGGRDHTTAIAAVRQYRALAQQEAA